MKKNRETKIVNKKCIRKRQSQFPHKLAEMLKSGQYCDSICWSEDGKEVIIKNKDNLANIIHLYFKTDRLSSFNRQLNIFGFRHTRNSLNQVVISNPNFTQEIQNLHIVKKETSLTLFDQHEELKKDLSLIQIQQQKLQKQIFILMQIQIKIQQLQCAILKTYLQDKVRIYTRRQLNARLVILLSRGLSRNDGFGSDVLTSLRYFIHSCLDEPDQQSTIKSQIITPQRLL